MLSYYSRVFLALLVWKIPLTLPSEPVRFIHLNPLNALFHFSLFFAVDDITFSFIRIPSHQPTLPSAFLLFASNGPSFLPCLHLLSLTSGEQVVLQPLPRTFTLPVLLIHFGILCYISLLFNFSVSTASFPFRLQKCYLPHILKSWENLPWIL